MDDNPENAVEMPFVPWVDVKSTNPVEATGIILFFILMGVVLFYLFKRRKETHTVPHLDIGEISKPSGFTYLDEKIINQNDIHSTSDLPNGIRVTLQKSGNEKQYDATIVSKEADYFTVFINSNTNHDYDPTEGEITLFFAEINNMRWSFSTEYIGYVDEGLGGYIFAHTYDVIVSHKRREARILKDLPALFSVISRSIVIGPVPVLDLLGKIKGEIPATIHDISASGCAVHTRAPNLFNAGDLAVISFLMPDDPEEYTVFASVNKTTKKEAGKGGGSILNMEFIKIDEKAAKVIDQLVSSHIEDEVIA